MLTVARAAAMCPTRIWGNKRRKEVALIKSSFEKHIKKKKKT